MSQKVRKPKVPYGLKVTGTVRIFTKAKSVKVQGKEVEIIDSWFTVSNKLENGNYENKSMNTVFNRDQGIPEHNSEIELIDAWFMLQGKDKYQKIVVYVKEWEYVK